MNMGAAPSTVLSDNLPEVAVVILNWNNYDDTAQCLDSLANLQYPNFRTIIVDNGSTDGSAERLMENYDGDSQDVILNKENLGYAGGNNRGIKLALSEGADYILLLNNDTVVKSAFLDPLVATAEASPLVGIVGPKVTNYSTKKTESTGFRQSILFPFFKKDGQSGKKWSCDYVHGCAVLISSEVFDDIGLLDEEYFLYTEERDFYIRAQKEGYKIMMNPDAEIYHKGMGSTGGNLSAIAAYWKVRNLFRCWQKHFHPLYLLTFVPYMIAFSVIHLRLYRAPIREKEEIFQSVIKAWATVFTGRDYDQEFKPN